jgi:hypothetical protein
MLQSTTSSSSLKRSSLQFYQEDQLVSSIEGDGNRIKLSGTNPNTPVTLSGVEVPVNSDEAANKQYVDNLINGLAWIDSVLAASAIHHELTAVTAGYTIDGIVLSEGDRVLLKNQTVGSENGVYLIQADGQQPVRPPDMSGGTDAAHKSLFVDSGTVNKDTAYVCTTDAPNDIVGTDSLTFVKFSSMVNLQAGKAIAFTGANSEEIDVKLDPFGGIEINTENALKVRLEAPLSFTDTGALEVADGTVLNAMLVNDSVTVTAGDGLIGGGLVALGEASAGLGVNDTVVRTTGSWNVDGVFNFSNTTAATAGGAGAIVTAGGIFSAQNGIYNGMVQAQSFNSVSDERKKEMIKEISPLLARQNVQNLRAVTWKWREQKGDADVSSGFIAQAVDQLIPEAVNTDADGNLTLNYRTLWTQLLASHQLLVQEHAELKASVQEIRDEIGM